MQRHGWILILAIGAVAFERRDSWLPLLQPATPARLALNAVDDDGQLRIRWDGASMAVRQASGGTVVIADGPMPLIIPLDATHLQTGTLTYGRLRVVEVLPMDGVDPAEVLRLAASLEMRSEHPIGKAIVAYAVSAGITPVSVDAFQAIPGRGAEGQLATHRLIVGSHRLFEERGLCSTQMEAALDVLTARGCGSVMVAAAGTAIGVIGVADEPREGARDAVALVRQQGIQQVILLTGDQESAGRALAESRALAGHRASLLPEDKVAAVEDLRRRHGALAMIGDGVNDAPALAAADVGIAMGVAGTDAALETADIALMADELLKIPYALRLSRATTRNIRANIAFSIVLKGAFLVLAVTGVATLWMAVAADMGASLIVIANALRLLRE